MRVANLACAALLAASALDAMAVQVDPDGVGQALIFPYYTTRSGPGGAWNTYLSVVNNSADAKALRVRLREGRNGREVLAFNTYLAPHDSWTGALIPASASPAAGAELIVADSSCMSPVVNLNGVALSATGYTGSRDDGYGTQIERTREGYVEVIEMASLSGTTAAAVSLNVAGFPANCALVRDGTYVPPAAELHAPTGGLSGTVTLINVNDGMDMGINAEALSGLAHAPFFRPPSDPYPDFDAAEIDRVANVSASGAALHLAYASGADAVSAALMRASLANEYILDALTGSSSSWVVTLPTRRFYAPGTPPFAGPSTCEATPLAVYDREARAAASCDGAGCAASLQLCYAASVVDWTSTSLFGSTNAYAITQELPSNGWARLTTGSGGGHVLRSLPGTVAWLPFTNTSATGASWDIMGLPMLGFAARTFRNGTLHCSAEACQGDYGGAFVHRYRRAISPAS